MPQLIRAVNPENRMAGGKRRDPPRMRGLCENAYREEFSAKIPVHDPSRKDRSPDFSQKNRQQPQFENRLPQDGPSQALPL
jgi:hypothetical protein